MSERPTPETDAAERMAFAQEYMVPTAFARKLERERDQAREAAAKWESSLERAGAEQARRADENREWALRAERERDEAREALENHTTATIHTCHSECKRPMCVLRRERDEAREKLSRVLKLLDDYDQAIKNPSSPFWDAFKKWFTYEAAK